MICLYCQKAFSNEDAFSIPKGEVISLSQCSKFKPKNNVAELFFNSIPVACGNCIHWGGKKCKDEAELLAEWEKKHGAYEHMMRDNKGV